ncbi:MAG: RNA polymerase sigma factor [Patescibacteria group bacterium]
MSISDDKKRFSDIYNKESDALFRFCLLRVSDREKAIDITQEAFTRLWSSISSGKPVENPRALVFVIARNLIIDWYRRTKSVSLEGLNGGDEEREFDPPDEKATLEIETSVDAKRALEMIESLESQYREVIYFRFVEDLQPREIAEILEINVNTVSVRLTRGLEALRKLMGISRNKYE